MRATPGPARRTKKSARSCGRETISVRLPRPTIAASPQSWRGWSSWEKLLRQSRDACFPPRWHSDVWLYHHASGQAYRVLVFSLYCAAAVLAGCSCPGPGEWIAAFSSRNCGKSTTSTRGTLVSPRAHGSGRISGGASLSSDSAENATARGGAQQLAKFTYFRLDIVRPSAAGLGCERSRTAELQLGLRTSDCGSNRPGGPTGNTVYLGGAYGGVWKSSNALSQSPANVAWTPLTDMQATLAIGAIAIQPQLSNPNPAQSVILVGTGEANSSTDSYYGLGILLSVNAGGTWTLISSDATGTRPFAGMAFSRMAFSPRIQIWWSRPRQGHRKEFSMGSQVTDHEPRPLCLDRRRQHLELRQPKGWHKANRPGSATGSDLQCSRRTVLCGASLSRFLFFQRRNQLDTPGHAAGDRHSHDRLSCQTASSACPIYRGELAVVPGRNEMYVWFVDANNNDQGIWNRSTAAQPGRDRRNRDHTMRRRRWLRNSGRNLQFGSGRCSRWGRDRSLCRSGESL